MVRGCPLRALPLGVLLALTAGTACMGTTRPVTPPTPAPQPPPAPASSAPQPPGTLHTVAAGDTLWSLAVRYGSSVDELAEVNGLTDSDTLGVGQVLFIPAPDPMAPPPPPGGAATPEAPALPVPPTGEGTPALMWPVDQGVLFSGFGPRQGSTHDGIDLGAPEGTPIRAAAAGVVLFAGTNQGAFGSLIILKHANDTVTVYAHNRANMVRQGQSVAQGQVIGEVGTTGTAQTPHVHFEVRVQRRPVDPEPLLPEE